MHFTVNRYNFIIFDSHCQIPSNDHWGYMDGKSTFLYIGCDEVNMLLPVDNAWALFRNWLSLILLGDEFES